MVLVLGLLGVFACTHDATNESPTQNPDAAAGSAGAGGAGEPCTMGVAESTATLCSDDCDNDESDQADCDDVNCCAVRADCDPTSTCGSQPEGNPWEGALLLDDARLKAMDPEKLPSGIHPCHQPSLVRVNYAVDGDTLDVTDELGGDAGGRVRVIGVDTPEVSHGADPAECYGPEAASFASQLTDHLVWLTFDSECRDSYGRLLAYVYVGEGINDQLERQLLRRGLARAAAYGDNRTFRELFALDEQIARDGQLGQWGACDG